MTYAAARQASPCSIYLALFNIPKYIRSHSLSLEVSNDPMISLGYRNLCDYLSKTINLSCDALVESSW